MQGDPEIIEALNQQLTCELTTINQYYVHYKMCENWGYAKLAKFFREESIDEMKHADQVIERILFFDGVPNMQRLSPIKVGEDPIEQLELALESELFVVAQLNKFVTLAASKNDSGTREFFEGLLVSEEEAVDFLEAQLGLVKDVGRQNYLAEQISA